MASALATATPLPVSAAPKKGSWTPEMATRLSLLNNNFNLSKSNSGRGDRVGRIFKHVFQTDLDITHPNGLTDRKTLDYYDSRTQATRTKIFKNIIEVRHPCQDQRDRVAKVLPLLRQAIAVLGLGSVVVEGNVLVAAQGGEDEDEGEEDEEDEEEVEEGGETNKDVVKVECDGEYDEAQSHRSRRHAKRSRTSEVQTSEPVTKRRRTSNAVDASGIRDSLVDRYGEGVVVKAESSNRETVYSRSGRELKPTEKLKQKIQGVSAQGAGNEGVQVGASSPTGPLQFVGSASLALQQYFAPDGADFEDTHLFDLEVWAIETGHRDAELEMQGGWLDGQGYGITDPILDNGLLHNSHDATSDLFSIIENHNRPRGMLAGGERRLLGMHSPVTVPRFRNNGMPLMSSAELERFGNPHWPQAATKSEQTPANIDSPYIYNDQISHISAAEYQYITQTPSL
ncbi:hypothetical protein LTR97_012160 [Elasticomyces elasticus]|uniref:Uncharacterized protein n=1 Tax=Elasticomyces elasticus TaxID=574655 RepID=A0AAN7W2G3_9PEZI|nr:hypothetical protein LTR97_012160 [Elasticomyces elasticus]